MSRLGILVVLLAFLATGCEEEGICDADGLSSALARAFEDDSIEIGSCRIAGAFVVPPGVTLSGSSRGGSVLQSTAGEPAVRLEAGTKATSVTNLTVRTDDRLGILARGEGKAAIEGVTIHASRGIALGVEGVTEITISDLLVSGPVTAENHEEVPNNPTWDDTATHGVVLVDTDTAELSSVEASGFARFGALFIDSATSWTGGNASKNMATGLMVKGGSAYLQDLVICDTLRGSILPYSGVFSAGADVETQNVRVCNGELGLLHDDVFASHVGFEALNNKATALWVQGCPELRVQDSLISSNELAGVVLVRVESATIIDTDISGTRAVPAITGTSGYDLIGDGVHIVDPIGTIELTNMTLVDNERIGILYSAESTAGGTVETTNVTVSGEGEELGGLGQGGGVTADWDDGITREGTTEANDAAHTGGLAILDPVATGAIPDTTDIVAFLRSF